MFWSETDKSSPDKSEPQCESGESGEHVDDDDETVPHWFRQLDQHDVEPTAEEIDTSCNQEVGY